MFIFKFFVKYNLMKIIRAVIWIAISSLLIQNMNMKSKRINVAKSTRKMIKEVEETGKKERQLYNIGFHNRDNKRLQQNNYSNSRNTKNNHTTGKARNLNRNNRNSDFQWNIKNSHKQNHKLQTSSKNESHKSNYYGNYERALVDENYSQYNNSNNTTNNNTTHPYNNLSEEEYKKLNNKPAECDLSVEVFPLYYTPVIRSSTFRIAFSSNCLPKMDINFEVYYKNHNNINFNHNPTIVNLDLWGNHYNITYSKPKVIDPYDVMRSLEYREANMTNFLDKKNRHIDLTAQNEFFLDPQQYNAFTKETINLLRIANGLVKCELFEKKVHGWELLKRIRTDTKKRRDANQKKMDEMISKAREDAMEFAKNQQQSSQEGRQLQETGFSFYKPPIVEDPESEKDPETHFPEENLDMYMDDDSDEIPRHSERIRVKDKNSVWGYATPEKSDYYDDTELPLEAEAPVKQFENHKKEIKRIMKMEYVEEYRILCRISNN